MRGKNGFGDVLEAPNWSLVNLIDTLNGNSFFSFTHITLNVKSLEENFRMKMGNAKKNEFVEVIVLTRKGSLGVKSSKFDSNVN